MSPNQLMRILEEKAQQTQQLIKFQADQNNAIQALTAQLLTQATP